MLADPVVWHTAFELAAYAVGALLGGLAGVEIAKHATGVSQSTGDSFVWPLCVGMCIGRIGC